MVQEAVCKSNQTGFTNTYWKCAELHADPAKMGTSYWQLISLFCSFCILVYTTADWNASEYAKNGLNKSLLVWLCVSLCSGLVIFRAVLSIHESETILDVVTVNFATNGQFFLRMGMVPSVITFWSKYYN